MKASFVSAVFFTGISEMYSASSQTFKTTFIAKKSQRLKSSILDARLDSECASVYEHVECNTYNFIKKETPVRMIVHKFGKINIFFTEHHQYTASV